MGICMQHPGTSAMREPPSRDELEPAQSSVESCSLHAARVQAWSLCFLSALGWPVRVLLGSARWVLGCVLAVPCRIVTCWSRRLLGSSSTQLLSPCVVDTVDRRAGAC